MNLSSLEETTEVCVDVFCGVLRIKLSSLRSNRNKFRCVFYDNFGIYFKLDEIQEFSP